MKRCKRCSRLRSLSRRNRRNIDPSSGSMTLKNRIEDLQLPQSVDELRILRCSRRCDRGIKTPEDLLKRVVVAFALPARKVCVLTCSRQEEGRVLHEDCIATISMSDPKFVRPLLVPGNGSFSAVDLHTEIVLASSRHLAGCH